nr:4Fe-4S binding protein [Dysgonomonas sp. Marseille-P4677]
MSQLENNCISCNRCKKLCPVNNITIEKDKPQWGKELYCVSRMCTLVPPECNKYRKIQRQITIS